MGNAQVIVNLPRDLGDCLLCIPAIKAIQSYCAQEGLDLIAIGTARSQEWVEALGELKLNRLEAQDAAQNKTNARFLINLNFYDNSVVESWFSDVPVYQPEQMTVVPKDTPAFGAGAVVGKKHVSLLLEDCLKDAGVLTAAQTLPAPQLPGSFTDSTFVRSARDKFGINDAYALLIPVCAADRPLKRWEEEKFVAVAQELQSRGIQPVLIGGPSPEEERLCGEIAGLTGGNAIDLSGQTNLAEIGALAAGAVLTTGNDTGPSHIAAASGAPVFVLFGYYNDANTWSPALKNPNAHVIQGPTVQAISVTQVLREIETALVPGRPVAPRTISAFKNAA